MSNRSDRSVESDRSDQSGRAEQAGEASKTGGRSQTQPYRTLRPHGGYRRLRSFQVTQLIYDATVAFCDQFVDKRSRTHDQMVQAARSGCQNIAEGSRASATSSTSELRLVNVARASLDELLLDFEDFLRQRGLQKWAKDDPEALAVRALGRQESPNSAAYARWLQSPDPVVVANTVVCLIHQANYLLDRQIQGLERQLIEGGGYRERLHAARLEARSGGAKPHSPLPVRSAASR